MIRKFLGETLDLVLALLAKAGLLRGGSGWTRYRLSRRLEGLSAESENTRRAVGAKHRMCRECRALVLGRAARCPECGASMSGVPRGGIGRLGRAIFPSFGSASTTVVGLLVVIFLAVAIRAGGTGGEAFNLLLLNLGAKWTPWIVRDGEWWRLVNPIFLHGSLMHIGFNAYALANLGPVIEGWIGSKRFLVVFMTTGVFSFVVSALVSPGSWSVGASGALFGLIGFGIVHGYVHAGGAQNVVTQQLMRWAVFGLLMMIVPFGQGIDHAAHVGGFVAGALLGWLISGRATASPLATRLWTIAAVGCSLLPLAGLIAALLATRA